MFKKILSHFYIVNLFMIIAIIVLKNEGFEFISNISSIIFYIVYYVVTILGIYSIRKLEYNSNKKICIYLLPILYILMSDWILIVPIIFLFFTKPSKLKWLYYTLLSILVLTILFISFLYFTIFRDFTSNEVMQKIEAPDKQHVLVHIRNDQGALGGGNIVELVKEYKLLGIKQSNRLYLSTRYDEDINMEWIDNNRVKVNGKIIKIGK